MAFFALGILVYVAIRSRTRAVDLEKAVNDFRSLDIEAFRNLVDPAEEAFLRDNLSPRKFRAIKRQRMWAALIYAWEAGTGRDGACQSWPSRATELGPGDRGVRCSGYRECSSASMANRQG